MSILNTILHPIWLNPFFYLFVGLSIATIIAAIVIIKYSSKKNAKIKLMQQQHAAKIDIIRNDHSNTLERIRVEMLKREEERSRQWIESEKETLNVLNGVSMLLDLNDKMGRIESDKILKKLEEIREKIEKISSTT
jgi:hypothetical protein